ncbi:hypothetical protein [Actinomyces sp. MRS3W]|nr:hypothetical protein [Actinomyces sp. MRS3W]MDU0349237.1 hypothetical protein [Actinomyces sp. MRS3W]
MVRLINTATGVVVEVDEATAAKLLRGGGWKKPSARKHAAKPADDTKKG